MISRLTIVPTKGSLCGLFRLTRDLLNMACLEIALNLDSSTDFQEGVGIISLQ